LPIKQKDRKLVNLGINDVGHLCYLLHTNKKELDSICEGIKSKPNKYYYRQEKEIKGKPRQFATPIGRLRIIVDHLNAFLQRLTFPDNMHGGLRGRTTRTYAKPHVRKETILKSDLENFFPNIRPGMVYRAFIDLKCKPDVARYLTRLTTLDGQVPLGSPTSTVVANIVSRGLAIRLENLAKLHKGVSGTFVDDIAISGPSYIGKLKPTVLRIIQQEGFHPNLKPEKTAILYANEEQILVGMKVNNGLDIPVSKITAIQKQISAFSKYTYLNQTMYYKDIDSIKSKIHYVGTLNPGAANSLMKQLYKSI